MKQTQLIRGRRRQKGQSSLWFLAMLGTCCAAFALVYNVGQVANQKEATINAADAAALSGAVVEARMLNFEAYANRAQIANEVSVAQLVSLDSWLQYDNQMVQVLSYYADIVPIVDEFIDDAAAAAQTAADVADTGIRVAVAATDVANVLLAAARQNAVDGGAAAADDIAAQIASANSTTFGGRGDAAPEMVSFAPTLVQINAANWNAFTQTYTGDGRANERDVINRSLDQFTTARKEGMLVDGLNTFLEGTAIANAGLSLVSGGALAAAGLSYDSFDKTSTGTQLDGYDDWVAQDSIDEFSHHPGICGGGLFGILPLPCMKSTPLPPLLAYGHVEASTKGDNSNKNLCNYRDPTTVNCDAAVDTAPDAIRWNGIPDIQDLAVHLAASNPCSVTNASDGPSLAYVAAVQKSAAAAQTTDTLGTFTDSGAPAGAPPIPNGQLAELSAACTFFLRPNANDPSAGALARGDGAHEYASLYNPYWQARLTAPPQAYMDLLYAYLGAGNLNDAMTPAP
jgi:hypothetical protein